MERSKDYQEGQGSICKPAGPHPLPLLDPAAGAVAVLVAGGAGAPAT
jgi:hypothetical protein